MTGPSGPVGGLTGDGSYLSKIIDGVNDDDLKVATDRTLDALSEISKAEALYTDLAASMMDSALVEYDSAGISYRDIKDTSEGRARNYFESADQTAGSIALSYMDKGLDLLREVYGYVDLIGLPSYIDPEQSRTASNLSPVAAYRYLNDCLNPTIRSAPDGTPYIDCEGDGTGDGGNAGVPDGIDEGTGPDLSDDDGVGDNAGDSDAEESEPGAEDTGDKCECKPIKCGPVDLEPTDDPACISPSDALAEASARGWAVAPIDAPTDSNAPWSKHYVVTSNAGISRRILVTGVFGASVGKRGKPPKSWYEYGINDAPDGLSQIYAEFDPTAEEPPVSCEPPTEEEEEGPEEEEEEPDEEEEDEEPEEEGGGGDSGGADIPFQADRWNYLSEYGLYSGYTTIEQQGACAWIQSTIGGQDGINGPVLTGDCSSPQFTGQIQELLGWIFSSASPAVAPLWTDFLEAWPQLIAKPFRKILSDAIPKGACAVSELLEGFNITSPATIAIYGSIMSSLKWIERVAGFPVDYIATGLDYQLRYTNPMLIPSQADVNGLMLTGYIDSEEWECLTRMGGNLAGYQYKIVQSQQSRVTINDLIASFRRGLIDDIQFDLEARKLGFNDSRYLEWLKTITQIVPQFGDIIRFMVRDVVNEQAVQSGQYDKGFDDNYTGILRQWAEWQGLPENVARAFWRAHWELPSNTALYEMVRRLRPGVVDPSLQVTIDDAKRVMQANDIAPGYVDKLLAVSYNPLTRTDIKQGYFVDAFNVDTCIEKLQDTGLNKVDSEFVASLWTQEKSLRDTNVATKIEGWTRREVISKFVANEINYNEALSLLIQFGIELDVANAMLDNAYQKSLINIRTDCTKAVKRRYMVGEIADNEVYGVLVGVGHDDGNAKAIASRWRCTRDSRRKELPLSRNVSLYSDGIISQEELYQRLLNLGYTPPQIDNIFRQAELRMAEKIVKEINKGIQKQIADRRKFLEDLEKKIKEREKKLKELQKSQNSSGGGGGG